jgi:hypothetical protein
MSIMADIVATINGYGNIDILIRDVRSSDMTGKLRFSDFFLYRMNFGFSIEVL